MTSKILFCLEEYIGRSKFLRFIDNLHREK